MIDFPRWKFVFHRGLLLQKKGKNEDFVSLFKFRQLDRSWFEVGILLKDKNIFLETTESECDSKEICFIEDYDFDSENYEALVQMCIGKFYKRR